MTFNINEFKSRGLIYGGARPALFQVQFDVPRSIQGINGSALNSVSYVCRAAELPAATVGTVEVPYFGRRIKLAGDRTFADWTVTIMNDEDFGVRTLFEAWSNGLNRLVSNVRDPGAALDTPGDIAGGYKADLSVYQYGKDGTLLRGYTIVGAFPTDVGAIALDWDNQNQIETFQVTFAYDYWTPETAAGQTGVPKSIYFGNESGNNVL